MPIDWGQVAQAGVQIAGNAAKSISDRKKQEEDARVALAREVAEREKFRLAAPQARAQRAFFGESMARWRPQTIGQFGPTQSNAVQSDVAGYNRPHTAAAGEALSRLGEERLGKDTYSLPRVGKYGGDEMTPGEGEVAAPTKKRTPWWKKALGIGALAAPFIPGIGPFAKLGITAGSTIANRRRGTPPLVAPPQPYMNPYIK